MHSMFNYVGCFLTKNNMETKLQEKIIRFIELSKKFSKSVKDVFGKEDEIRGWQVGTIAVGSNNDCVSYAGTSEKESTIPTRSELILEKARAEATMSDEYDEYKALQKDLEEYFKITSKLTQ